MTAPTPGDIYERDGKRREVISVTRLGLKTENYWQVRWTRPDRSITGLDYWCNEKAWEAWATKAKLVQEAAK